MIKKIIFGIRNNQLVSIEDVQNGLNCNCICPSCKNLLVAKKGKLKTHHFAHYNSKECENGPETALHLASKEIIKKYKKIVIPELISSEYLYENQKIILSKKKLIEFEKVILEKKINDFIPDIICSVNGQTLFIEIAVTHFVDEVKYKKIQEHGISTIEIDLSEVNDNVTHQELKDIIINQTDLKYWIYNSKENKFLEDKIDEINNIEKQKERELLKSKIEIEEKVNLAKREKLDLLNFSPVAYCPDLIIKNSFKMTRNYVIDKLRKGKFWNGKIYDSFYKTSIWLDYKELELYPSYISETERKLSNKVFGQLNVIREKSITYKSKCEKCAYFNGYLDSVNRKFACSYRKKAYNNV